MRVGYKLQDKFDFGIFIPMIILICIGGIAIYSSTLNHFAVSGNFQKQIFWTLVSIAAFFVIYFLPRQTFKLSALPIYIGSIFFLAAVLFAGKTISGAKSWLSLGPFSFQPAEFAKVGTILFLSYWIGTRKRDINNIKDIAFALAIGFFPVLLILLEPDMGTAIVFIIVTVAMIFWGGINLFGLFVVLSPGIIVFASIFGVIPFIIALVFVFAALVVFKKDLFTSATIFVINVAAGFFFDYGFKLLKPHQQRRIETFVDPLADPLGSGYNALQAKVAIGSGGLFGKGFLQGSQTQLSFIPEQWTDFIFCVIGEEFGFIGSMIVLIAFVTIFLRLLKLAATLRDKFSSLIVLGILALLFTHFSINVGMNIGIAPVIGVPLPFVSYGGSSLLVNSVLIGIVLNIYRNRKQ